MAELAQFEGMMKEIPEESFLYQPELTDIRPIQLTDDYTVPDGKRLYIFTANAIGTKATANVAGYSRIIIFRKGQASSTEYLVSAEWSSSTTDIETKTDSKNFTQSPYELYEGDKLDFRNSNMSYGEQFATGLLTAKNVKLKF